MEPENQKLERLIELAVMLNRQNDFQEILRVVTHKAASLLNAETVIIMMINPQTRQTVKSIFKEGAEANQRQYHEAQMHVSGWMVKHNQPFMSTDLKTDPRFIKNLFENIPVKTVLGVPLQIEGIMLGTLIVLNAAREEAWTDQDLAYLEKLAAIATPFLRNVQKIQQYFVAPVPEATLLAKYAALGLLGKSRKFIELLHAIEAAAPCDVRVLLEGQTGTGKELIACAVHQFSGRCDHPWVAIDCGAIQPNLIESELFGHVRGAFTGATADRKGLLEAADHGTLFMDEISNLPLDTQARFMRVLQEGEVRPVGSNQTRKVDVRIISASSIPLRQLVDSQKFREDLFFRLHVYPIHVPPLNDRQEDIPFLANHFLKKFAAQQKKQAESFHAAILDFMQQRQWAGNIRELENFVERLVALAPRNMTILDRDILPEEFRNDMKSFPTSQQELGDIKSLNKSVAEFEAQLIKQTLIANDWNQTKTARRLKISEQTLRYKMKRMGLYEEKSKAKSVKRKA